MSFAVAGVGLYSFKSGRREYVSDVVNRAATVIASAEIRNPDDYAELLMLQICDELNHWGNLSSLASGIETKTRIHLDGYILDAPMRRTIMLNYEIGGTSIEAESVIPGMPFGYGSESVWKIIFGSAPDSRLASYRQSCQSKPVTLEQAIRVCKAAICAHCDPEALTIDRENCQGVGGRIRIATVTPEDGFRMVSETDCPQSI
jgi:hypothetical protein